MQRQRGIHRLRVGVVRLAALILLVAGLEPGARAAAIKKADWVADYTAVAMGTGHSGAAAGRASRADIEIYRWTTPEERQAMLTLLATGDGKAIRSGLEDLEVVGRIRIPGQRGLDLVYAYQFEDAGKKTVVTAANRPLASLPGATSGNRVDYLVGVAILELDASGEGTGNIAPAIELAITPDGKINVAESAADPIRLTSVKSSK